MIAALARARARHAPDSRRRFSFCVLPAPAARDAFWVRGWPRCGATPSPPMATRAPIRRYEDSLPKFANLTRAREARAIPDGDLTFLCLAGASRARRFLGSRLAALRSYAVAADGHPSPIRRYGCSLPKFANLTRAREARAIPDGDLTFCVWPAPAARDAFWVRGWPRCGATPSPPMATRAPIRRYGPRCCSRSGKRGSLPKFANLTRAREARAIPDGDYNNKGKQGD